MAASDKVANESITSLKKTNICPDNQLAVMNEKDHQRTGYSTCNNNEYYIKRDRKNGPDYHDERRDGTSRTTDCVSLSNMYTAEGKPTRKREQEEILIMQELQPLPSRPKKKN